MWLSGPGPGATLCIPDGTDSTRALERDRAQRFLVTAGVVLQDARGVPGGGRWQRGVSASLESMADHAPGKASFGVRIAKRALDDLVATLLRNAGRDPLDGGFLGDTMDAAPCVEAALDAAFDVALVLLRIDGVIAKSESRGTALRGGTGRAGSPKGMPGDIPPLM